LAKYKKEKGTHMKLYLMQLARNRATGAPIPGYLVRLDDGTNVLIDTGYSREHIGTYLRSADTPVQMDEQDFVINQLARLGLIPQDIHYLICTHFDRDHAGNHDLFSSSELVVQRHHYKVARSGEIERFKTAQPQWDAPGLRYRFVEGDTELLPGISLIETSGHVPGHQAVLLRLPETGPVILAIDAIPTAGQLDPDTRPLFIYDMDEAGVRASTRKLVELARREQAALIIHGHDAQQWSQLKKLPNFYA
jgi:N-acyl homoserine lactone hydrolase